MEDNSKNNSTNSTNSPMNDVSRIKCAKCGSLIEFKVPVLNINGTSLHLCFLLIFREPAKCKNCGTCHIPEINPAPIGWVPIQDIEKDNEEDTGLKSKEADNKKTLITANEFDLKKLERFRKPH